MTGSESGVTRRDSADRRGERHRARGDRSARVRADEAQAAPGLGPGVRGSGRLGRRRRRQSRASPACSSPTAATSRSTGPDGRYTLPLPDEATIFVVKPAGFMPPVDPLTRLPRFYRHHQPKGSPRLAQPRPSRASRRRGPCRLRSISPSSRQDEPKAFDVVMVTDPQPETEAEVDFIREDLIEALAGVDAKFGLTAGDIMFDDLSLYPRLNAIIGTIGLPWWNIGGNHDLNFEAPDRTYSRETYKRFFGPNYYAFFYAQTLFLMLDDVDYLGSDPAKPRGSGKYEGRLDEAQLEFVRGVLAETPPDDARRRSPAYSDQDLSGRRALAESREQGGALSAARGSQTYGKLRRPHPHDRAPLFRRRRRLERGRASPPSRADRALGLVVERPLRPSRRSLRRQP